MSVITMDDNYEVGLQMRRRDGTDHLPLYVENQQELKSQKAYSTLRISRNDAKLAGIRKKKLAEKKDEE